MKNNKEIKKFIKDKKKEGLSDQDIWNILIEAGHEKEDIEQYFPSKNINEEDFKPIHERERLKEEISQDKLGSFDDLNFDFIECSKDIYKRLIWKEGRWRTVLTAITSLIFFIYAINVGHPSYAFGGFLIISLYFVILHEKAKKEFYRDFSAKNNLNYRARGRLSEVVGNLFKVGHTKRIRNVITGKYGENKAKFFHYSYSIGHDRNRRTFNFTVLEVFFDEIIFPHMLLQTRGKGIFWSRRHGKRGKNERSVALESELNDYYNLFFHDGYGVEATQIFSEEFLRFLRDENSYFDIELNKDRLYIYDSTAVKRKKEFEELFRVAGRVINRIVPVLKRLKNDFAALNKYYN